MKWRFILGRSRRFVFFENPAGTGYLIKILPIILITLQITPLKEQYTLRIDFYTKSMIQFYLESEGIKMLFKKKDKIEWRDIINSYLNNPRDVKTVPLDREGKWFHVYADNDDLYIGIAADHSNTSNISQIRKLDKDKFEVMLDIYHRRMKGEQVSKEATNTTQNQVYWYGIFNDLNL